MHLGNQTHQRHLDINGTFNVRDLGGYKTSSGHTTRWNTIIRADKLNRVSPAGRRSLVDYGIRTIIDLRYAHESASEPDVFVNDASVQYVYMPLYQLSGDGQLPSVPDDLKELYRLILDHRQAQINTIISELLLPGTLPAIVHCTAGKDRTGIIAALLLGAAGVPHETIVEDYVLSDLYLNKLNDELRLQAKMNGYDSAWFDRLLACQPETMQATLDHLHSRYGGINGYLLHAGLSDIQLQKLRELFVN